MANIASTGVDRRTLREYTGERMREGRKNYKPGAALGLVTRQQSAGDVIQYLGDGAERLLRDRSALLLESHEASREE